MFSRILSTSLCAGAIVFAIGRAQAAPRQLLLHHVPEATTESRRLGPVSRSSTLNLAVGLPLRNAAELHSFVEQVADPTSPNYRHYLSAGEFTERFGPTQEVYDKLTSFFQANGFRVFGTHANRMILDVNAPVEAVEKALHVNMVNWEHPKRGQFFAPDQNPWLDVDVEVLDITGLDNYVLPQPMDLKTVPLASSAPFTTGSGPAGLFIGNDFRAAYAPGVTRTGAKQTVGLFELDGFYEADVTRNFAQAGLPAVPVQTVLLDGFSGNPGSANIEVILDIMMAAYMAPGASIMVYEGTNWNDVLNRMATDNIAEQLSSSWCFSPINSTTEQIFQQMIAQGQSLMQASGDSGAYSGWIMPPADDPNVTVVGGTSLTTNGAGGPWQAESVWGGSGGGVSTTYTIPSYQQSMNMSAIGGSNSMRNIPDVALLADIQIFLICDNGAAISVGGTSAAAPLWAGFLALANEQAAANGKAPVGFINPTIYGLGAGSNYSADMHDITTGSDGFPALPGYDLATGWGTPAGQGLINTLTASTPSPSFTLSASPSSVSVKTGSSATSTIQVTAQNGFSGSVNLSVSGLPSGVTASFGAINASGASTLTLTASASAAAASNARVTVTGTSGNLNATVGVTLNVTTAPAFSLSVSPSSLSVAEGASGTSTITVTPKTGFTGKVTLTASGLPAGVTASYNSSQTSTTSVVTFNATSTATTGTSTVTLTGTQGPAISTITLALTIKPAPNFTLTMSPTSLSLTQGISAASTITLTPANGFSGSASLAITGLPGGVTASFSPAALTSTTKMTLSAAASATVGTATATLTATSGSISQKLSIPVTITVAAGFKLSASATSLTANVGGKVTTTVSVSPEGSFDGTVALSTTGLPAGVTASFSPSSTNSTSTLTLTATNSAVTKASQFTIAGTSGNLSANLSVTLAVIPQPDFSSLLAPASLSVVQGGKAATAIEITPLNGFSGTVTFSASGLPTGVTASFGTASGSTLSLVAFAAAGTANAGTSKVTLTATSGALSHSATVSLTVVAAAAGTVLVDLSPYYNVPASAVDYYTFSNGGLDAGGRSYSGLLLGASQSISGTVFSIGPMGVSNAVSGQTVTLPAGQFTTLKLLATGVNGNQANQTFTVTYTDGTTTQFKQSLSDWCTPQNYSGESNAVPNNHRDNSTGTIDVRSLYLYSYSFVLNSGKTVQSLTLPQNRNVVVLSATLSGSVTVNKSH